jgi:23S rRNA (cytosine1962-C5)-methyltransferase
MKSYPQVILRKGKDAPLRRFHPWVFSGAIYKKDKDIRHGDLVEIHSSENQILGYGFYEDGSLAIKVFSFNEEPSDSFWKKKILSAYNLRKNLGLVNNAQTNAYRLVFTEADGLPGLIIDYYNGVAVIQANSAGMYALREKFTSILQEIYGEDLKGVYDKSAEPMRKVAGIETIDGFLYGSTSETEILESGYKFKVDFVTGQKTGFFLDQRESRELVGTYAAGRRVLNTFCYTGGFSVYALKHGAKFVHSVDSSKKAVAMTAENLILNGFDPEKNECIAVEAMDYLDRMHDAFDLIILDPPAFAKHIEQRHKALTAYRHINHQAISKIASGGILFTFSCSQVVDRQMFTSAVMAAAIETGRNVRILKHIGQPTDHPVNIFHPEGEYLKGLVIYVE